MAEQQLYIKLIKMLTEKSKKFVYNVGFNYDKSRKSSIQFNKQNIENAPEVTKIIEQTKILENQILYKNNLLEESEKKIHQLQFRYEQVIEKMKQQFISLEENMSKIQKVIQDKDNQISKLKSNIRDLSQKSEKQRDAFSQALSDKDKCIVQLTVEIQRISAVYKEKFDVANQQTDRIFNQNKSLIQTNNILEQEINRYRSQTSELNQANSTLQLRIVELQEISKQNESNDILFQQQYEYLKKKNSQLQEKNSILKQQTYSNQNELRLVKQEFEAYKMLKEIEIMELKSNIARLTNNINLETIKEEDCNQIQ